jgi:hypothetical protein
MGFGYFFTAIKPVNCAGRCGEKRNIAKEMRGNDMAFQIKWSNGGH